MSRHRAVVGGIAIGALVFVMAAGAVYLSTSSETRRRLFERLNIEPASDDGTLEASGFIEADEVDLAAEIGGRVTALPFEEGDEAAAGDILVQLDTALLEAQREAAQAQLDSAIAQRDLLRAGVREEIIAQAEAQVATVQAAVNAASVALSDAVALRNNPQDVEIQLVEVEAQVASAGYQVEAAAAQFQIANRTLQTYEDFGEYLEDLRERLGDSATLPGYSLELSLAPQRYDAATANLGRARDALETTQGMLAAVRGLVSDPQAIQAQVVNAQTALATAEAELALAQAELDKLRAGPTDEQLRMADAQVEQAEALLNAVETRIQRMRLESPIGGIVLEQSIHEGELAVPGVPVITLANLDEVELTVYISAAQFDSVALNQQAFITVDSFPPQTFAGVVVYISDEAEFTPRSVQTREERVNLVYAVKIQIANPDHLLKPGMPADARFSDQ
jgi:multidrug efflux pump subunit AcrA (membrane-fusion protein)